MQRQREVREAVLDRRERRRGLDICAESAHVQYARGSSSSSISGRLHSPPQMPSGGTLLEQDRAGALDQQHAHRTLRQTRLAGRGDGSSSTRRSLRATQSLATGQSSQRGDERVQTVAPRSINACV